MGSSGRLSLASSPCICGWHRHLFIFQICSFLSFLHPGFSLFCMFVYCSFVLLSLESSLCFWWEINVLKIMSSPGCNATVVEYYFRVSCSPSCRNHPSFVIKMCHRGLYLIGPPNILVQIWYKQNSSGNRIGSIFSDPGLHSFICSQGFIAVTMTLSF